MFANLYLIYMVLIFFIFNSFQILAGDDVGWRLVTVDENKHTGLAPPICQAILNSPWFRSLMMTVILANGLVMATMNFKHDQRPRYVFYEKYYYFEVIPCFTKFSKIT